ncbi:MAG: valine--tRNA ligase [Candidatus Moranbacteria bacterium]|nr:valine--tRNA ligase [Candidatus Moranbacteria bacterium]
MKELPKIYEPQKVEDEIYARWEKSGFFQPEAGQPGADNPDTRETYCDILPPPNANGELHIGHASGYTVMDIFGRYARMNGKKTLLLPGKDHAGIQTQVVFEKKLQTETGKTRQEIGREEFYEKTYAFCMDRAGYMRSQEKKIGISADWSREKFTLDPDVLSSALETFVQMHKKGLIYKGKRIINWCPRCATALSDVEVLHKDTPGKLYFIKYPLENSSEFITVATTRPETMLGDSGIAVNPKDKRFKKLVGKNAILPLQNKVIPIFADQRIDLSFGTGAVKITPSHDPLDWEIGKDHQLEEIQVINEKALITELGGKYVGMTTHEAREAIIQDLEKLNLLEKIEDLPHSISICERCKTTIEPLTSKQWFIDVNKKFTDENKVEASLKERAIEAINNSEIEIFPLNFKKILLDWFDNMRDWCISRQIWWGPQFPVWYRPKADQPRAGCADDDMEIYVELTPPEGDGWFQDENTFDTWFTSGQWAHTTLEAKKGDEIFYPSNMMVMGRDLLFFWASRMIMMSLYATKQVPFKNLFFTGLVRDKDGHKFSKSRGNGIDPLTMIDKFGADALRMSLIMDSAPGQDSRLYEEKIETFRNFANKLWNISRYCLTQEGFELVKEISTEDIKTESGGWIICKLDETIFEINKLFKRKQIAVAADILKSFTWNEFADWYLEINKIEKDQKILGYILDKILRLWHPFMPFITEHIWTLAKQEKMLMISSWPKTLIRNENNEENPNEENKQWEDATIRGYNVIEANLKPIIIALRNIRAENKVELNKKISIVINGNKSAVCEIETTNQAEIIMSLKTGVEFIKYNQPETELINMLKKTVGMFALYVDLAGAIDTKKETAKAEKEIANLEKFIAGLSGRLENKEFVSKAPEQVIAQQKETLAKKQTELNELKRHLETLK